VFSQDGKTSLGHLPPANAALILQVMADRTRDMAAAGVGYVLPFENRGVEMGVTLHHPHAQIYGYDFIPDYQHRIGQRLALHQREHGRDLVVDIALRERSLGIRMVAARDRAAAFVPAFARFPYETWLIPSRPAPDIASLADREIDDLASLLQEVLRRLDRLWERPMPYLLTVNQAPPDRDRYPGWTVRVEIWPIRRAANKLKFLAGTELGTGVFASDMLPEDAATKLRSISL
jgi:UDPglucose--hexose-1-phosphate uridylyltransferase